MTVPAARPPETTFQLMYRSHNRIPHDRRKVALGDLFSEARSKNKARGITGALLVSGDWFVQVLEGDETDVRTLVARIERDTRHDHLEILETSTAPEHVFARWSMARVGEDGEQDIPLISHTDGISPAAGKPTTTQQDQVLELMRQALKDSASL